MSTWLTAWRNREDQGWASGILELLVVAGADAGARFTLEGDEILIGRGEPESGQVGAIRLTDRSISRRQALIRREAGGTILEHISGASNPTRVNGVEASCLRLAVGDRIELGRVVIEVQARPGLNLTGIAEPTGLHSAPPAPPTPSGKPATIGTAEATELRPMRVQVAELVVLRGPDVLAGERFPVQLGVTRIGRGEDAQVRIPELGVSRLHAELVVEGRSLVLLPRSTTNPTLVNGISVLDRTVLAEGDEIQLADRVVLGLRISAAGRDGSRGVAGGASSGLIHGMARKLDIEREIESFKLMGSFLDVDVVASRAMKGAGERPEYIIVSFERFRSYVSEICREFLGQVLNSNGDELMCFFESADQAVCAGSAILERLDAFNREKNLLGRPFRFRLGVHTGLSLVDLAAGIAYSEVLDLAGHIQKCAEPDTLLISEATLAALPRRIAVSEIVDPRGEAGCFYRVDERVGSRDPGGRESTQLV